MHNETAELAMPDSLPSLPEAVTATALVIGASAAAALRFIKRQRRPVLERRGHNYVVNVEGRRLTRSELLHEGLMALLGNIGAGAALWLVGYWAAGWAVASAMGIVGAAAGWPMLDFLVGALRGRLHHEINTKGK